MLFRSQWIQLWRRLWQQLSRSASAGKFTSKLRTAELSPRFASYRLQFCARWHFAGNNRGRPNQTQRFWTNQRASRRRWPRDRRAFRTFRFLWSKRRRMVQRVNISNRQLQRKGAKEQSRKDWVLWIAKPIFAPLLLGAFAFEIRVQREN